MPRSLIEQQTIALAGVAQAARIVDQLSRTGSYPLDFLEASVRSLFSFDAPGVDEVYGNVQGVKLGLQSLAAGLASQSDDISSVTMRYTLALLHLEGHFRRRPDMQQVVHSRLQHAHYKANHFAGHVDDVCRNLAAIYSDTLSTLRFRIKVTGSAQHLQDNKNADVIRALLLAGVRSGFLWHQLGGRRWKLVLQRGRVRTIALDLARELGVS